MGTSHTLMQLLGIEQGSVECWRYSDWALVGRTRALGFTESKTNFSKNSVSLFHVPQRLQSLRDAKTEHFDNC